MYDEEMKDVSRVYVNDILDVLVDFENDSILFFWISEWNFPRIFRDFSVTFSDIFYWLNEKLQGYISCKNHHLMEGELYPVVNLSSQTEVSFLWIFYDFSVIFPAVSAFTQ